jgi:hypothetical protein
MNKRDVKTNVTFVILLLLSVAVRAQVAEPQGELTLYTRATQIGTVARREFKDDKGRIVRVIYYTGGGSFEGPYREELLREQSIRSYTYDDHNCRIKCESYEPGLRLSRTEEVRCFDGTATPSLTTVRDVRGIKEVETRHTASGSTQTILYFDKDGDKVVAIDGELPTDADLAHGWGEMLSGFACGIAANPEKGRQEDLQVHVTIKNVSHEANGVVMISPVLVELKDLTGRVIEPKAAYTRHKDKTESDGCPTYMSQGAPFAGRSQPQTGYELGEQYNRLAPGKYSITITYCVSGVKGRLVSNTIPIEVEGRENR